MKNFFTLLLILLANTGLAQTDFEKIISNVTAELKKNSNGTAISNTASTYMSNQNANGSWPDIAYASGAAGDWPFKDHLNRMYLYSLAYTLSTSPLQGDTTLYNHLSLALQYWNSHIHDAANWYQDQIGYPLVIGQTLVLMRGGSQQLATTDYTNAMNYLATRQNPSAQAGANRIDVALHWLYRGALTANASVVTTAVTQAGTTVNYVSSGSEGLNYDNAFLQHGPELYTQHYGAVWISDVYTMAAYIRGTAYSFSAAQLQNAYTMLHHSYNGGLRGRYKDFNLIGRGLSGTNNLLQDANTTALAMQADPAHYASLRDDSLRISGAQPASYNIATPYNIHYWTGDYTLHNRPDYAFSVRNVSTRTNRSEVVNGENLLGTFLTDGATDIRVNGNEYYNIFPVWDWNQIPGVTMRQFATPQQNPHNCCSTADRGNEGYVGGVSDSTYGCSANTVNYYNVAAKKAWFFFDKEIVCLGAGITSTSAENVGTNVNQCLLDGTVSVSSGGTQSTVGIHTQTTFSGNLQWALHDSVGYFFPAGGNVKLSNQAQTGNWKLIKSTSSASTITKDVFKLWIDHGAAPTNGTYAYIVAPNLTTTAQMNAYNQAAIKILSNTVSCQAVKHDGLNILQVVARATAGVSVTDPTTGIKLDVDKPCAVLLKNIGSSSVRVSLADPAQSTTIISVSITFPGSNQPIVTAVTMPTGNYKGSTKTFLVRNTLPVSIAAVADAYVRDGTYANANYGTDTILVVKGDNSVNYERETFLKFDVSGINTSITSAKLRMSIKSTNVNVSTARWQLAYVPTDTWTETGLTWSNKPASTSMASTQLGVSSGYVEWDIKGILQQELASGNNQLSLRLINTVSNAQGDVAFYSREATTAIDRPTLVINGSGSGARLAAEGNREIPSGEASLLGYPNPFDTELLVKLNEGDSRIEVFNILGQPILSTSLSNQSSIRLPTSSWDSGRYYLRVWNATGVRASKQLIKK
ncbi:polysaccharide lyase family 8 super-sandwich domain-containing protein [Fibrella sp. WM1]|uniref:polysaccharide lyase family 8 super-sandwich domain-containing protein n=1 Tax=Fibrella musci TaxID=3242485 RepID=UPI0035218738